MQRQSSDSMGLQLTGFSVVDKQKRENSPTRLSTAAQINRSNASSPRKQGIQISLPIDSSPLKDYEHREPNLESPTNSKRTSISSDHRQNDPNLQTDHTQEILYKLAAKKRQIVELEQALNLAKKELHSLETHYESIISPNSNSFQNYEGGNPGSPGKQRSEMMQNWSKRVQKTIEEVNNSPNVIKSKKSISSFFNGEPNALDTRQPLRDGNKGKPSFFQNILERFNEFTVDEEEEEEFDRTQNSQKDDFYLKEKLDYDDEEDIPNEETGHTLLDYKRN